MTQVWGREPRAILLRPEREAIFREAVWPLVTGRSVAQLEDPPMDRGRPPWTLWIIAPPGHLKSTIQSRMVADVSLDGDLLEALHPSYEQFALRDDRTAGQKVASEADQWIRMVFKYVQAQRLDLTVCGWGQQQASDMRRAGRRNEALILAGDEDISLLRTFKRYLDQRDDVGFGGWVPAGFHHESYRIIVPSILDDIHRGQLVQDVYLLSREGGIVHSNTLIPTGNPEVPMRWQQDIGIGAVLHKYREQPWSEPEFREFRDTASELAQRLPADLLPDLRDAVERAYYRQEIIARRHEAAAGKRLVAIKEGRGPATCALGPDATQEEHHNAAAVDRDAVARIIGSSRKYRGWSEELMALSSALTGHSAGDRAQDGALRSAAQLELPNAGDQVQRHQARSF